jgi:deoxyribonuclease-4
MLIGAHTPNDEPLAQAAAREAELVQIFLSNPQSWKKPAPRDDAADLLGADIPIYVHAPYLMNLASPNNRIRIPSRKTLAQSAEAAEAIGASGLIVHGGHVGDDEDVGVGFERWRKALDSFETTVPILVENTAGGGNAVVRELVNYGPLWEEIGDFDVGVCIDTCHAWAGGDDLASAVDVVREATGHIDLVHCNDSRDPHDSRRDRHANLGAGEIPEELILSVVTGAGAPVVVETPGGASEQGADIRWLRERISSR